MPGVGVVTDLIQPVKERVTKVAQDISSNIDLNNYSGPGHQHVEAMTSRFSSAWQYLCQLRGSIPTKDEWLSYIQKMELGGYKTMAGDFYDARISDVKQSWVIICEKSSQFNATIVIPAKALVPNSADYIRNRATHMCDLLLNADMTKQLLNRVTGISAKVKNGVLQVQVMMEQKMEQHPAAKSFIQASTSQIVVVLVQCQTNASKGIQMIKDVPSKTLTLIKSAPDQAKQLAQDAPQHITEVVDSAKKLPQICYDRVNDKATQLKETVNSTATYVAPVVEKTLPTLSKGYEQVKEQGITKFTKMATMEVWGLTIKSYNERSTQPVWEFVQTVAA